MDVRKYRHSFAVERQEYVFILDIIVVGLLLRYSTQKQTDIKIICNTVYVYDSISDLSLSVVHAWPASYHEMNQRNKM